MATSFTAVSNAAYQPPMELTPAYGPVVPLKNAAMIEKTDGGLRYIAGQQHSHLTITQVNGNLVFTDTGTLELRDIPSVCTRRAVPVGISAVCRIPAQFASSSQMYLEVWPRLGNDWVDGSTLPSKFRMWVLADQGNDVVRTGAGDDFVNGASGADRVWGGAGDDWIRTGLGNDILYGEGGNDKLVGVKDNDAVHGGTGDDLVFGGPGVDHVWGDAGVDNVNCGTGQPDVGFVDGADRIKPYACESVNAS